MRFRKTKFVFLVILTCFFKLALSQVTTRHPVKTLNVADGLPQSFISSLVQDSVGFIWIGTRDGLARYDGIKFKIFRSFPGDTSSLSNNIISGLFLDKESNLWISYETGDIDVLNTATEKLFHFTKDPLYKSTFLSLKNNNSIVEDKEGNIYFLCSNGGIFICDLKKHSLRFYPNTIHGFVNNRIMGFQSYENNVILVTDTALVTVNSNIEILQVVPYTFSPRRLYTDSLPYKNAQTLIRKTGEVIIKDNNRLVIFNPVNKEFSIKRLPRVTSVPLKKIKEISSMTQDETGNIFFDFNADIFILSPQNELKKWKGKTNSNEFPSISMLIDQAGLLWVGGNGNGIKQFDLRLTKLSGLVYKKNFHEDVLNAFLQVPIKEIEHSFLHDIQPYNFRWARGYDNKIWMSKGGYENIKQALLCYFDKGHLVYPDWRYTDTSDKNHYQVNAMAFSGSGKLWGIDYRLHPVYFNTATKEVTVLPAVAPTIPGPDYTINSLLIDGENIFWISTSLQGLYRHDKVTGKTIHFTENESPGSLPTNQLTNMINDPDDKNIIWIGSLGGGLIRFNKTTGKCSIYTTNEGLPNNTIYAVMSDVGGKIWCSSNKGFFSFIPATGEIRSFTRKDGLLGDEFNRFHFLQLPDTRIAFGGVDGYTVFDPSKMPNDTFQPIIALTGFKIKNTPSDVGNPASPIKQAINSLEEITLPYDQNFLTFDFAALEYNITEKIRYRYMLERFDEKWIYSGNDNTANYTNIPPGSYTLKINATNTSGKWSSYMKSLNVVIQPPWWKTWWFISLCIIAASGFAYALIRQRIAAVRREEQQKAYFEREALELKAQALRAQMNPHFIFNCLNSIKALIQENNNQKAVSYLTTFSKLIRNQLNSAQREISLYDELETCKLYVQLESLRFSSKVDYEFKTDENADIHSLMVPPLILQPFIENAIWHGILPKEGGKVTVSVSQQNNGVQCLIDDNGIGREKSMNNKSSKTATYQSKGMKLVQGRLMVHNNINNQKCSIEVIDKKDNNNNCLGTTVLVNFKKDA